MKLSNNAFSEILKAYILCEFSLQEIHNVDNHNHQNSFEMTIGKILIKRGDNEK